MRRSGRRAASWHRRRRLEVPTVAPGGSAPSAPKRIETNASRGSARAMTTGRWSPGGSSTGTSFIECTATSARPSSSARSSSLTNNPLPPTLASGASSILSPLVRIATSSTPSPGFRARNAPATCSACQSARGLLRVAIFRSGIVVGPGHRDPSTAPVPGRACIPGPMLRYRATVVGRTTNEGRKCSAHEHGRPGTDAEGHGREGGPGLLRDADEAVVVRSRSNPPRVSPGPGRKGPAIRQAARTGWP